MLTAGIALTIAVGRDTTSPLTPIPSFFLGVSTNQPVHYRERQEDKTFPKYYHQVGKHLSHQNPDICGA